MEPMHNRVRDPVSGWVSNTDLSGWERGTQAGTGCGIILKGSVGDMMKSLRDRVEREVSFVVHRHEFTEPAVSAIMQAVEENLAALREYCCHDTSCPLAQWSQGRPTKDGGYETMYAGKWYQGDDKPACTCGLGAALAEVVNGGKT
jgi:hypothetical protein